jgi:hypothetical protein
MGSGDCIVRYNFISCNCICNSTSKHVIKCMTLLLLYSFLSSSVSPSFSMSRALIVDGLWYCLCPSFRYSLFARSFVLLTPRRAPLGSDSPWSPKKLLDPEHGTIDESEAKSDKIFNQTSVNTAFRPKHHENTQVHSGERGGNPPMLKWRGKRALIQRTVGVPEDLQHRSTSNLESMLQQVISKSPNMIATTAILRVLIRDRHVRPQVRHYRALILANTDGKHGSPDNVRKLLKEMEENGIAADSGTLHSALQVGKRRLTLF